MHQVIHSEKQYIRNKLMTVLVLLAVFLPFSVIIAGTIIQLYFGIEFGSRPVSDEMMLFICLISFAFVISILMLFKYSNLIIEVRTDGFYYKYFPFHRSEKSIKKTDIIGYEIIKIKPIADYGGWGICFTFNKKKGKGYIASGSHGVKFQLNNRKRVLFTTEKPEQLKIALDKVFS